MMTPMIAAYAIRLVISSVLWSWIHKMRSETCECSGTWKREFLYWSLPLELAGRLVMYELIYEVPKAVKIAAIAFDGIQLGMLWSYARDTQAAACECSAGWRRALAQSWPVFRLGVIAGYLGLVFAFV